jgi:UDPglucose 6-dehydrogenase
VATSTALAIVRRLAVKGAVVRAFDPTVRQPLEDMTVHDDPYAACEGADVLAVLTEWDDFRWVDFDKVAGVMPGRAVVDARNLLDRSMLQRSGFTYQGIGR